ncbi:MAG: M15 family metallopeptidase [Chitinophagaceae bacterium]|nr:M15 family metallopeptidase [Chitinophagaceae bacterium]
MSDAITIERIKQLHPKLRDEASKIYAEICEALKGKAICRFSYTTRTFAEQALLFAKGRTAPGPVVTNARAGKSYHNYGLAVDIVLLVDTDNNGSHETASWNTEKDFDGDGKSDWQEVVAIFKQYGWEWGGDWKFSDKPHFQKTFGKSINQLLELYNQKKLIPQTNFVNI